MNKLSYALGMSIAQNLLESGVQQLSFEDFTDGLKASFTGTKPALSYKEANDELNSFFEQLQNAQAEAQADLAAKMKEEGEAFLRINGRNDDVKVLPSGLQYKVIRKGTGKKPSRTDKVRCHYEGKFVNGDIFDSSYRRGEPAVFGVNQVIAGWTEALQLMSEGAEWELYIPYQLAYGEAGAHGSIPPCAALIFKVELIAVI